MRASAPRREGCAESVAPGPAAGRDEGRRDAEPARVGGAGPDAGLPVCWHLGRERLGERIQREAVLGVRGLDGGHDEVGPVLPSRRRAAPRGVSRIATDGLSRRAARARSPPSTSASRCASRRPSSWSRSVHTESGQPVFGPLFPQRRGLLKVLKGSPMRKPAQSGPATGRAVVSRIPSYRSCASRPHRGAHGELALTPSLSDGKGDADLRGTWLLSWLRSAYCYFHTKYYVYSEVDNSLQNLQSLLKLLTVLVDQKECISFEKE